MVVGLITFTALNAIVQTVFIAPKYLTHVCDSNASRRLFWPVQAPISTLAFQQTFFVLDTLPNYGIYPFWWRMNDIFFRNSRLFHDRRWESAINVQFGHQMPSVLVRMNCLWTVIITLQSQRPSELAILPRMLHGRSLCSSSDSLRLQEHTKFHWISGSLPKCTTSWGH